MKLFKFKKEYKSDLTVDDLVLMAMLNFPQGALGESVIHEFLFDITSREEFKIYHEVLNFNPGGFSIFIHRSIESNSKHLGNAVSYTSGNVSSAMLSDDLRFDFYDYVFEKEKEFSKNIIGYSPRVYYLSGAGRSVAILVMKQKLSKEQREIVKHLADKL